jgi:hypothetical protein
MPSTSECGSARHGPRRYRPATADTAPTRGHPDHRHRPGIRVQTPRSPRPASVWPCAAGSHHEGTDMSGGWLLTTVLQIVTTYTRHDDHVLLLSASAPLHTPAQRPPAPDREQHAGGIVAGVDEAAWAVVRLGRRVHTLPAARTDTDTDTLTPIIEPISTDGSEPTRRHAKSGCPRTAKARAGQHTSLRAGTERDHSGRYQLIITVVEPRAVRPAPARGWADLLHPRGVLAVITHSDTSAGRLIDPTGAVVRAAHHAGLAYLDHIALLHNPLRRHAPDTTDPTGSPPPLPLGHRRRAAPAVRVHSDFLIFSPLPATHPR